MNVLEREGPRGAKYFYVDFSDGRRIAILQNRHDNRVWLGRNDDQKSWSGQRGGIGSIPKMLDEWFSRIALDDDARLLYDALRALVERRSARGD